MAIVNGFKQVLLAVLVCIVSLQGALGQPFRAETCQFASKRLPTHIQPERYQVLLDARGGDKALWGKIRIHLNIGELGTDPFPPDTQIPDDIVTSDWDFTATGSTSAVASELVPLKKQRLVKRATGESSRQTGKRPMGDDTSSQGIQPAQNLIVINSIDKILYSELSYYSIISEGNLIRRRKVEIRNACFDPTSNMLVITLAENLEPGTRGHLDIVFAGNYRQFADAYYFLDTYDGLAGRKHLLFSNRLKEQPMGAAFPSFHEPAFRSIFEMSIIVDAEESGYSTMPKEDEHLLLRDTRIGFDPNDDDFYSHERARGSTSIARGIAIDASLLSYRKVVRFKPTPLMPVHLVGVVSGSYRELSHKSSSGLPIRIILPRNGEVEIAQYFVNIAGRTIDLFENIFGLPYPVPSLDIFVAFERNSPYVGLIKIKRKFLFLSDGMQISSQQRSFAVAILVRAIATNYINMYLPRKWWTDNWFHGVIPYLLSDKYTPAIAPEFERISALHDFTTLTKDLEILAHYRDRDTDGMNLDNEQFEKMLATLQGLEEVAPNLILGHVIQLMKSDLPRPMNANQILSGLPPFVQAYLFDWSKTRGYPVVTVTQIERKALAIRQERAVLLDTDTNQLDGHRWPLLLELLVYRNDNQEPESIKLAWSGQGDQLRVQLPDWFDPYEGHWYVFKKDLGYHRIRYGSDSLDIIRQNLRSSQTRAVDKRLMVDDAVGLLEIGYIDAIDLIHIISMFIKEQNLHVISRLVKGMTTLKRLYPSESTKHRLGWFACGIFQHLFERYGAGPQPNLFEVELGSLTFAYDMLVASGSEPIIATLIDMYRLDPTGWKQRRVPDHIIGPMLAAVARHGTDQEFSDLLMEYKFDPKFPIPETLLRSLATAAPDIDRVKQLIVRVLKRRPERSSRDASQKMDSALYRILERILKLGYEIDPVMNFLVGVDKSAHDQTSRRLLHKEVGYYPSVSKQAQIVATVSQPSNRARLEANSYRVRQLNLGVEKMLIAFLNDLATPEPSS